MPANRLALEKSPYLQQHAHNPVDWYPWGPEAMAKAKRENRPIFLSVGYSTCHWCHVMERESFEDEQIAAILNSGFVPVKVDREERPDIDRVYMAYVQASTGSGGWPMSVWLTPDGKPFFGGTYFPPDNRYGRPGFGTVLEHIQSAWTNEHERIVEAGANVMRQLEQAAANQEKAVGQAGIDTLNSGFFLWRRLFDARHGGFGEEPKFPRPAILNFLLRYWFRTKNPEALEMATATLKAMAAGGMNDQLGGGFHRYSVDAYWFVPHFEKMLYDQAQLTSSLVEAFQITKDPQFASEARRVLDYVRRDLTSPQGAFYSAEDADSAIDPEHPDQKGEGAFYIWSAAEIEATLGVEHARFFNNCFGVKSEGNVDHDPHGEFTGRNILFRAHSVEEAAHHFEVSAEQIGKSIDEGVAQLLSARSKRLRPHLDDKILCSWNGLMISAFAKAAVALEEPAYAEAARVSAAFIRQNLWNGETKILLRRYREGEAAIPGFLDDYAFLTRALLDLYETRFNFEDLEWAITLAERQVELFFDQANGGFFSTAKSHDPDALIRMKDDYDGAEPSGNAIAVWNLLRLERMTGRRDFGDRARDTLHTYSGRMQSQPYAVPLMLCALDLSLAPPQQVVIAGEKDAPGTAMLLQEIGTRFQPQRVVMLADKAARERFVRWNPAFAEMRPVDFSPAAYVCENFTCKLPVTEVSKLSELLQ